MVPPLATTQTFCASYIEQGGLRDMGFLRQCVLKQKYFSWLMAIQEKQILAKVIGIQKEK